LTLALMRHAKSDWTDENLSDHDRPLNARGRRDAPEMARWLAEQRFLPEVILASTAVRVRETIDGLLSVWSHQPLVMFSQSLYLPTPTTIMEHVRYEAILTSGQRPKIILVVAHNPAMEQLVSNLAGAATRMPTAAVAVFECEPIDESNPQSPQVGRCIAVGRPKEI
jgi:phosphohistidine phosphatase